jgi:hypothetical protein
LLKSGTVGAVLPNGGRIHHYVSCNDSLGRRHAELNETFLGNGHDEPEQTLLRSAGRAFSGSEVFDDLFWGRGNSRSQCCPVENLLRLSESSFSNAEVFEDCSGGNSRLSYLLVWGAVLF